MPRLLPATVLALGLCAVPAAAQERLGAFSGSVDGAAHTWHVLAMDGEPSAGWYDHGMMAQVEIFGYPRADSLADVTGALEIGLTLMGETPALVGASVVYYGEGVRGLYIPESEEAVEVDLTGVRQEGERLHLSGTVAAEVFRLVSLATEEIDPEDGHRIAAEFELTLDLR